MTVNSTTGIVSWDPTGTPGTYSATIEAANNAGVSDWTFSYILSPAGTDVLAPLPVSQPPTGSNIGQTSATLTWPATTDNVAVAGYTVELQNSAYNPGVYDFTTPDSTPSYTVTGLPQGSNWYVRIYAFDAAGNVSAGSGYYFLQLLP